MSGLADLITSRSLSTPRYRWTEARESPLCRKISPQLQFVSVARTGNPAPPESWTTTGATQSCALNQRGYMAIDGSSFVRCFLCFGICGGHTPNCQQHYGSLEIIVLCPSS